MLETTRGLPYPPLTLMNRVGSLSAAGDPHEWYDQLGEGAKQSIVAMLPDDWTWPGKRVLDFGCGAGRTLRHFGDEAEVAEIHGCDIDAESVDWIEAHLVPPLTAVVASQAAPPLPYADDTFDLVYAVSVFTHLSELWAPWLCEMHRVLAPGGLLIATFIGEAVAESITGERWDDAHFGISISHDGQSWDFGGPMVVHSPRWLRAHWGRLFAIDEIEPYGFGESSGHVGGHGIIVARKDDRAPVTPFALEVPDVGATDEEALSLHLEVQRRLAEVRRLRQELDAIGAVAREADLPPAPAPPAPAPERPSDDLVALRDQRDRLEDRIRELEASTSWRVTAPLRTVSDLVRARREASRSNRDVSVTGPPPVATDKAATKADEAEPVRFHSQFGGLWYDRIDAPTLLQERVDAGRIDEDDARRLRQLSTEGFTIIEGLIDGSLADELSREIDAAVRAGDPRFWATVSGFNGSRPTPVEPWMVERPSLKVLDSYVHLDVARDVLLHPELVRFLGLAFDEDPVLFQSLNFVRGSEQWLHQDTAYVKVDRPVELVACWVALEDVQPGSGELVYVPGSHRLPEYLWGGEHKAWIPDRDGSDEHDEWVRRLPERAEEANLPRQTFLPRKGDVLFWHADLVHGGAPIEDPTVTRRSIVGHYCPRSAAPLYFNAEADNRTAVGNAAFSSDFKVPTAPSA